MEKYIVKSTTKHSLMQIFLGLITNGCNLAPGFALGFSAIALPALLAASQDERITEDQASWIASMTSIAMPVGGILSGPISNGFGKKKALLLVCAMFVVGWMIIATSSTDPHWQYGSLLTGRFITGLATGLSGPPSIVYISEICTPKFRGMITPWNSVFICLGVLIIYLIGFAFPDNWRKVATVATVVPGISFLIIWAFMPESPQWLVANNRVNEARISFARIRCVDPNSNQVLDGIELLVANKMKNEKYNEDSASVFARFKSKTSLFLSPGVYKPFAIMVTIFFFQQCSGVLAISFYAVEISNEARVSIDPYLSAIYQALARVIASILVGYFCKKFGRRIPLIFSGVLMTVSMLSLAGYLYASMNSFISQEATDTLSWAPATLIILYFFSSSLGIMTIPFAMVGEIYPARVREFASGLTISLGFFFNFIVVKIYPNMKHTLHIYGVFAFYGTMTLFGTLFVIIFLPETKGKTLEEIEDYFDSKIEERS